MIENLFIFVVSLFMIIKGATLSTRYSTKLAENFNLSKYVVGFIIVAFISVLPEAFISINSAIKGIPEFGLGTLFGSNVADLTLVFAILIIYSGRGIKIESKILKDIYLYPIFLMLPLVLGLNGHYSRLEGLSLIFSGSIFYYLVSKHGSALPTSQTNDVKDGRKNLWLLIFSMSVLLLGSHFAVVSAVSLAGKLSVSPILIGMLIVSLGTIMPELFYSMKSITQKHDGLAIGDILGTVLADATIVVGILAFISPFYFPVKIIYISGIFMLTASLILLEFMRSGRVITKREGYLLLVFWLSYAIIEFLANTY